MGNTFKYTILSLIREKNVLIWAFAFPLVLATIFNFMFANLDEASNFEAVPVAVVKDAAYEKNPEFDQVIKAVSESGENQLLQTSYLASADEARALLEEQTIEGYLSLNDKGEPSYHVGPLRSGISVEEINRTIIKNLLDTYVQNKALITEMIEKSPSMITHAENIEDLLKIEDFTTAISITENKPKQTIRYFYALLGFSAMMAATIGLVAISATLSKTSALGARRSVGATSKFVTLSATLLASWLLSFCCLLIGYLYIRYVFNIDFGGKDFACLFALVVASLVSTSLGTFIGSFRISEGAKSGIMTGLTCFLALFAGLYGEPCMRLADSISRNAPFLQLINPSKQIADLFYGLYYYDDFTRYFEVILVLLVTAGVLFAAATFVIRRQRHASL